MSKENRFFCARRSQLHCYDSFRGFRLLDLGLLVKQLSLLDCWLLCIPKVDISYFSERVAPENERRLAAVDLAAPRGF